MAEPSNFNEANAIFAKNQREYLPLPVYRTEDGILTSCWRLSLWERLHALVLGKVWVTVMTFNEPLQPQRVSCQQPDMPDEETNDPKETG